MSDWIEWNGGECPIVGKPVEVEVKLENGIRKIDLSDKLEWSHSEYEFLSWCNIIAYRVL